MKDLSRILMAFFALVLVACTTRFEADLGPNTRIRWGTTPTVEPTAYSRHIPVTPFPTMPAIATRSDAQNASLAALEAEIMDLYTQSVPAVVSIELPFVHPTVAGMPDTTVMMSQGSGFFYDDQGHVVTNAHVVASADVYQVRLSASQVITATVIGRDTNHDIAVLAIERPVDIAPLAMSTRNPATGMWVMTIGSPYGLHESMTLGSISAVNRELSTDTTTLQGMIQVDAVLNPGSSGGVLIDRYGTVIGLTTAIQSSTGSFEGIGYAIPAATLIEQADAIIASAMQDQPESN
ncbi:MAG: hypothetical protein RLY87_2128 [Chloroflexota bacterium]